MDVSFIDFLMENPLLMYMTESQDLEKQRADIRIGRFQPPGEEKTDMNLVIVSHGLTLKSVSHEVVQVDSPTVRRPQQHGQWKHACHGEGLWWKVIILLG